MSGRVSHDSHRSGLVTSHGRGGAGNLGTEEQCPMTPDDLVTPTLKGDMFTTGRGGTGNMAKNDPDRPEVAREAQDVVAPVPRRMSEGAETFGRGGAANFIKPSEQEAEKARQEKEAALEAERKHSSVKQDVRGWADRGKEKLFGWKKNKA